MPSLTSRERFQRMYQHKDADRVPVLDSPWVETIDRWVAEGMPTRDYVAHFDLDRTATIFPDNSPRYPEITVEETDRYRTYTTKWGATMRSWKHNTSTPEHIKFTVQTPDDWAKAKAQMVASDDRIDWADLKQNYKKWRETGTFITGTFWFGFDITHSGMVGTEEMLIAMLEEPEMARDMFEHELNIDIQLMDRIWDAGYHFDEVLWYDDMGYKNTQFFSVNLYRELLKPVHQRAIEWAHAHGIPARLHSCGDVNTLVPELLSIGLDGLNPLEVKAGMNPVHLKKTYGDKLLLHGGINAVLWDQRDVIIEQIAQTVPKLKENGGYIFASDHSIPPHVSLEDFTAIINAVKKYGAY
jgi:uroporphyrinogen decarboxylase